MSPSGLESGFVTLPRLSRSERQQPSISLPTSCPPNIHRGSLTDATDALLSTCSTSDPKPVSASTSAYTSAYSDSLPSLTSLDTFTFDLGPSLMSEVFGLIEEHSHAWDGEEAGPAGWPANEGSEMDSATISYVDSLLREDCGGGKSPEEEGEEEGEVVSVSVAERERSGMGMESERFQSASDVLARHYGGSVLKGQSIQVKKNLSYSYMDDEDEIKV